MKRTLHLCLFVFLWISLDVSATIYQYQDGQGHTIFTDQKESGAEEVQVNPVQSYTASQPTMDDHQVATDQKMEDKGYQRFSIDAPLNEATIQNNDGTVEIALSIDPALKEKDRVVVKLDGKPTHPPSSSLNETLGNVDRGQHTLQASVINENGEVVTEAASVVIYVRRPVVKPVLPPAPAPASKG